MKPSTTPGVHHKSKKVGQKITKTCISVVTPHPLRTDTTLFFKMNGNNNTGWFIYINTIDHTIDPLAVLSKNCLVNTKLIQNHFLSKIWKINTYGNGSWYHTRVAPKLDRLFLYIIIYNKGDTYTIFLVSIHIYIDTYHHHSTYQFFPPKISTLLKLARIARSLSLPCW